MDIKFILLLGILFLLVGCLQELPKEIEKDPIFYDPLESKDKVKGEVFGGYFDSAINGNGFYSEMGKEGIVYQNDNIIDYVNTDGTIEFYVKFLPDVDIRWYEKTFFITKPELFYVQQMHGDGLNINYISIEKDIISFELDAGGITTSISDWKAGEWHHIALTWEQKQDITVANLYLDNVLISSGELDKHLYEGIGGVPIGDSLIGEVFVLGSGVFPDGTLRSYSRSAFDELKIYDYAKKEFN